MGVTGAVPIPPDNARAQGRALLRQPAVQPFTVLCVQRNVYAVAVVGGIVNIGQALDLRAYLPGNACRMDDRRVHIYYENALKFIRKCEDEYDLIIVDSSDPFGPSEGLFTREFYGSCFNALRADGIMVNQQGSPFYAEDATAMQRSHQRIASTFPISKVYQAHIPTFAAGYWLFGFASKKYHPINDMDADAWNALNMRTRYYTSRLHVGAFYLPAFLEEMLREVEEH